MNFNSFLSVSLFIIFAINRFFISEISKNEPKKQYFIDDFLQISQSIVIFVKK